MIIGVPKEIKNNENRVSMMPSGVYELTGNGHAVIIQKGALTGSMIPDQEYARHAARILDTAEESYDGSDMIVKVKEPLKMSFLY